MKALDPMERKLLVMDLDGTVLADDYSMPEVNRQALRRFREAGHVSAYATGRRDVDMRAMGDDNWLVDYHIINNGGKIIRCEDRQVIVLERMDPEECKKLLDYCIENDLQLQISDRNLWMTNKMTQSTQEYIEYLKESPLMVRSSDEVYWQEGFEHAMASQDMWPVKAFVDENLTRIKGVLSQDDVVDFMPVYLTKWRGIQRLAELLGILPENIVTVGNHYNDIEMTEGAGIGIAVANSVPALKDAADYVTQSDNNDGALQEIVDGIIEGRYLSKNRRNS